MFKSGPAPYVGVWTELSDKEDKSEITKEQIMQLFGNIELQPIIREEKDESLVDKQKIQENKSNVANLSGQQKSRISFDSIKQAIKKALGRGER